MEQKIEVFTMICPKCMQPYQLSNFALEALKNGTGPKICQNCQDKEIQEAMKLKKEQEEEERRELEIKEDDLNFVDYDVTWSECKKQSRVYNSKHGRLAFFCHRNNELIGKPIQISQNIQTIALINKIERKTDTGKEINLKFIDDKFDARKDGHTIETLSIDFWIYRIIMNGKEYVLFSKEALENKEIKVRGMAIKVTNLSEVSKTLKFRAISTIFIVDSVEPAVKILNKEEIIEVAKDLKLDKEYFKDLVFWHPDGYVYEHTADYNLLTIASLLCGELEGYPVHRITFGPPGTGKTIEMECLDFKYKEEVGIFEAGNSTIKGLIPSFKEKPANPGYILKCNRIALADELMKMVSNVSFQSRYQELLSSYFGQLNMLLEHKERFVGSGNDNSIKVKATARIFFSTNPLPGKSTISQHIGIIDDSTLSRMIIWGINKEHQELIARKNKKIITHKKEYIPSERGIYTSPCVIINSYISIVDSLNNFLVSVDEKKVKALFSTSLNLAKEPMKHIWKARGLHHSMLLLDGITKYRCLCQDFDPTFTPKDCDYDDLERLLISMVKSWDSNISGNSDEGFY